MNTRLNTLLNKHTRHRLQDMSEVELRAPEIDADELAQDIIFKGNYETDDTDALIDECIDFLNDNLWDLARQEQYNRFEQRDLEQTNHAIKIQSYGL